MIKPKPFLKKHLDQMHNRDIAQLLGGMASDYTDASLDTITLYILWLEGKIFADKGRLNQEGSL